MTYADSLIRPTQVEVDLDRIQANVTRLLGCAQGAELMAVVKADGYGHGAIPVARAALAAGATWLGVATVEEGITLRHAGLVVPIFVLGYVSPAQAKLILMHDLRCAIFHEALTAALATQAQQIGRRAKVHLKVDTGMGRIGVEPHRALLFAQTLMQNPYVELEGVFTHLATADEPDNDYAVQQLQRFDNVLAELRVHGIEPPVIHAANSAGTMLYPQGHYNLVRAGIAIYGLPPDSAVDWPILLQPALTWRTHVGMAKVVQPGMPISYGCTYRTTAQEQIISLPVGYADGYFRSLTNKGSVLIHGQRCPVVGRVCMDQTMVRVPLNMSVAIGDEVVLLGVQGDETITAGEIASLVGTINYEVVCAIGKRVPRIYRKDGALHFSGIL
jgi:alanine racemase